MLKQGELLVNRYKVIKVLGGGSYGTVYLVDDRENPGTQRALKELVEDLLPAEERDDAKALFAREASILKSLSHKGLPEIVDYFSTGSSHYIVMEYIEGQTLEESLKKRGAPFPVDFVLPWSIELASILEYLHMIKPHPVIFRDLKPSNILCDRKGKVFLIDFGIARYFQPGKLKDTHQMGTPGFSPPEQYGAGQSSTSSDIFSLGATIYYLLTGQDMLSFNFRFPPLSHFAPSVPPWLEKVIMRCLSVNPGERYRSAADLLFDLENQKFSPGPAGIGDPLDTAQPAPAGASSSLSLWQSLGAVYGVVFFFILQYGSVTLLALLTGDRADSSGCSTYLTIVVAACILFFLLLRKIQVPDALTIVLIPGLLVLFLGVIMVPGFIRARAQGTLTACKSNLKEIGQAIELYDADHLSSGPDKLESLVPKYLKALPTCPAGHRLYGYVRDARSRNYTIYCSGDMHVPITKIFYPQYSAMYGVIDRAQDPGR
jgi:predicted Ser/Thr protein kinase